jgi:hypothetical protein
MNDIYNEVLDNSVSILDDLLATDEDNIGERIYYYPRENNMEDIDNETLYFEQ